MAAAAAETDKPKGPSANQLLFGFQGRAARLQFWLVMLGASFIFGLFWALVNLKAPPEPGAPPPPRPPGAELLEAMPWIIGIGLIWPLVAIGVKRLHDRGRSGWWMLAALVPVVGWAWLIWELGLRDGAVESNRFGEPVRAEGEATHDIRSVSTMFVLGFAAGLPALLIYDTLSLWLRESDIKLTVIGFFSLATLFTALKFLWAPIIDRTRVPLLTKWLGHRRSWMLVAQSIIVVALWLIAGQDPKNSLVTMAALAVMVGFFSATQDIVIDAWRIEVVGSEKQGAMAAAYQWGYRVAMIIAGVVPLILAEVFNWRISYAVMAAVMGIGIAATLAAPREAEHRVRPISVEGVPVRPAFEVAEYVVRFALLLLGALFLGVGLTGDASLPAWLLGGEKAGGAWIVEAFKSDWKALWQLGGVIGGFGLIGLAALPIRNFPTRPGTYLFTALFQPVIDFVDRYKRMALFILALICFYRVSDFVININNAFYLDAGFSKPEIAEVRKVFGAVMSIVGISLGGWSVLKLGLMRTLIIGAFLGSLSNLSFAWLALEGHNIYALMGAIAADNIGGGYAGTALIAYMSSLTSMGFTATQYALFSSLYALIGKLLASQSGRIVEESAKAAEGNGPLAGLRGLLSGVPPESYAAAMEKSQVTPAALGVGYFVFYLYTTVVGIIGMMLVFYVAARQPKPETVGDGAGEDQAPKA
ncbi:MFS transporter [Caulobacter sp. SLTY]|uniref:AmpG family muropeptide MFS transporter n=1 Tax=Caulobacter sp. SLTY TaxID=2683262 RepID=UPI0014129FA9|nr:MFS transporter [Caulobacter sp. SLTY]NBB13897.1 MFS transporter [Caulobacter sp. SLTY]